MALSYLALLVFNLFALQPIVRAGSAVFGLDLALALPSRLTNASFGERAGAAAWVALAVASAGLAFSSLVGFALSRWGTRARSDAVGRSPLPQIAPAVVLLAPLLYFLFTAGLLGAFLWIGAVYLVTAAPVCSWQLRRAFDRVPPAAEEAAALDGCGSWRSFYSVLFPAVAPALVLTALFSLVVAWDDFFVLQTTPTAFWPLYSLSVLLAALLLGSCIWAVDRDPAAAHARAD